MTRPTRTPRRRWTAAVAVSALLAAGCGGRAVGAPDAPGYPDRPLRIMAPADPGGGWDLTARAMRTALDAEGLAGEGAEVYNVGGAGGTVGLAEFVARHRGDPHQLMITGQVMVGAIETHQPAVDLTAVTPVASLTTEWVGVAVPADSPHRTVGDLVAAFRADPAAVRWGGGSTGGTDHVLVGRIAQQAGVDPEQARYVPHAGGGEALAALLSGDVTAVASGLSELAGHVETGSVRVLAVSSDRPQEGVDAPTLTQSGVEVVLANWRGVVAPPGLTEQQHREVTALVEEMRGTARWREALEANGWTDFWRTGSELEELLATETAVTETVLRELDVVP